MTRIHCLLGEEDRGWSAPSGYLYYKKILSEKSVEFVPNGFHGMHDEADGADAILRAILAGTGGGGTLSALNWPTRLSSMSPDALELRISGPPNEPYVVLLGLVQATTPMSPLTMPVKGWVFLDTSNPVALLTLVPTMQFGQTGVASVVVPGSSLALLPQLPQPLPLQAVVGNAACMTNMVYVKFQS